MSEIISILPEKYYEACITYHIIIELKRIGMRVYPYSISQREEKEKGYDFKYSFNTKAFLIQYKRPEPYYPVDADGCIYRWRIDREQLKTLNVQSGMIPTYYALPAFIDPKKWYDGIRETYFIDAKKLAVLLQKNTKTNIIRSDCKALMTWEDLMEKFRRTTYKHAIAVEEIDALTKLDMSDIADGLWLYGIEE